MIGDAPGSTWEILRESPPLSAALHLAAVRALQGRTDAALFGTHAVNAYVSEVRATPDVNVLAARPAEVAAAMVDAVRRRCGVMLSTTEGRNGLVLNRPDRTRGRRIAAVRPVDRLPPVRRIERVFVVAPAELIAGKLAVAAARAGRLRSHTDHRDIYALLLTFPELKTEAGEVRDRLVANGASDDVLAAWRDWVAREIEPEGDADEFDW